MTTQPLPSPEQIDAMADHLSNLWEEGMPVGVASDLLRTIASHLRSHAGDAEDAMRAALESVALPARVPDELTIEQARKLHNSLNEQANIAYALGWNACRDAMLSASPKANKI